MKFIMKYKIFESVKPYKFSYSGESDNQSIYYFMDEFDNEFRVEFDHLPDNESEVRYLVKDGNEWTFKNVNTNIFKILETIFGNIIPHFIKNNDWCEMIIIKGLGYNENEEITRRTKIYWRYLKNNPIEGWSIDRYLNEIYLDKN